MVQPPGAGLNIFGVMSGIISAVLILVSLKIFRKSLSIWDAVAIFFYFPYTIVLNLIIIFSVVRYATNRKKVFRD
jgi:membrane protein YdbS with pleckstrin-like domain